MRYTRARDHNEQNFYYSWAPTTPVAAPLFVYNDSTYLGGTTAKGHGTRRFRYRINYNAILYWLKNDGPNPFPDVLRAGGILFYDSIPDTITNPRGNMPVGTQAERNQRFWKEYIDYVLGIYEYYYSQGEPFSGGTRDYHMTVMRKGGYGWDVGIDEASLSGSMAFRINTGGQAVINCKPTGTDARYMNYRDSPPRPMMKYWFGPLSLLDFIENYNNDTYWDAQNTQQGPRFWLPGTAHQAPMWQLKVGVQTVIGDVRNNHPNDYLAVVGFSVPTYQNPGMSTPKKGYFNKTLSPLSPLFNSNYNRMVNSLWFPPKVIQTNAEIHPFDTNAITQTPRAIKGTCSPMAFMLAYNQFSGETANKNYNPSPAPDYEAGGNGRNGAQRLIIFETDGVASATSVLLGNESSTAALVRNGSRSYFKVRWRDSGGSPEYPNGVYGPVDDAVTQTKTLCDIITGKTTDTVPGFATNTKPVTIHCIAFGNLFDPSYTDAATVAARNKALGLLQYAQWKGGTQPDATTALQPYKIINQTNYAARIDALREAFSRCMQDAVTVTVIR